MLRQLKREEEYFRNKINDCEKSPSVYDDPEGLVCEMHDHLNRIHLLFIAWLLVLCGLPYAFLGLIKFGKNIFWG